jgi:hypothetical protein
MGHIHLQNHQIQEAAKAWATSYINAKQMNFAQALRAMEKLALQLGLPEGFEDWEKLEQRLRKGKAK